MRYHLMLRGKRTTITIDEILTGYLLAKLGGLGASFGIGSKLGKDSVRKWIQKQVKREEAYLPEKNISQWVQARILHEIVDPALRDSLDNQAVERSNLLTPFHQ
jgi:hypothetical protein